MAGTIIEHDTNGQGIDAEVTKTAPRGNIQLTSLGMTSLEGENKLNKHLLAYIRLFEPTAEDPFQVCALLEDGEFGLENQYSTPFENSNPEGRMPNLMGMIQSGQMAVGMADIMDAQPAEGSVVSALISTVAKAGSTVAEAIGMKEGAIETLESLKGRSTFTKLNSQQIYTSSNSVKISATLVLSAWRNAHLEVERALQKLQEWTASKYLYDSTLIANVIENGATGLFASEIPPTVSLTYGGKTYEPLVIESLSAPITAPMTADGSRIAVKCQVTFVSQKAWDKSDIIKLYG